MLIETFKHFCCFGTFLRVVMLRKSNFQCANLEMKLIKIKKNAFFCKLNYVNVYDSYNRKTPHFPTFQI